jgi:hypothetical protein
MYFAPLVGACKAIRDELRRFAELHRSPLPLKDHSSIEYQD